MESPGDHTFWLAPTLVAITVISLFLTMVWFQAKKQIRMISKRYRALVECFSDLVFLLDENGRYMDVIANEETLLVNKAEFLKGRTIFDALPEANAREVHQIIKTTLKHGPQVIEYKMDVLGGARIFEGRTSVLKSDKKLHSPVVVWVSRDITEKVEIEKNQKKLEAQLMQAQKMEAVAVTAGGVAHDLNNLLSSIVVYPDFIRQMLPPENSEALEYLDRIQKAGEQSSAIVKDLLVLSRKSNRESLLLNLNSLVQDFLKSSVVDMLKSDRQKVNLVFEPSKSEELKIYGSGIHITKILMNLVINAFEAISDSGDVRIKTYKTSDGRIALEVSDTGKGMSESERGKIFDPFYSGKSGVGLGLAVVWGIVQDHEGTITLDSTLNKGSTFLLTFPEAMSAKPLVTQSTDKKPSDLPSSKTAIPLPSRILVADDFEDQREVMGDVLERLGHQVETAASGREALDKIRQQPFDLVLLDMKMGDDWDGLETYENILKESPELKTVIVTGHSEDDRIKKALSLGVREVATKPLNFQQIQSLVERSLPQDI